FVDVHQVSTPATISGYAFDNTGAPLVGVSITLRDSNGVVIQTVTTASDGSYTITGVPPGTGYKLSAGKPNYTTKSATAGTDGGNPDGTSGTTAITNIALNSGDLAIN